MALKRIAITGGGTGGHVYPALAVAEFLKPGLGQDNILYFGNQDKLESRLVPEAGYRFEGLSFSGMPRAVSWHWLKWGITFCTAFLRARHVLARFKPDIAFGTGGYVTAPVLMAAHSLNIPYVIHEPDAYPGLVNRFTARWATRITCAFRDAVARLPNPNVTVTGNPLRSQLGQVDRETAIQRLDLPFDPRQPVLLVTGGSQGAQTINNAVLEALPTLLAETPLQILHQAGDKPYVDAFASLPEIYQNHPRYQMVPYIADMPSALSLADFALCRAGSMSLSELYQAAVPTILVPYPYAAADHQRYNAIASQEAGASLMLLDKDCTGSALTTLLKTLLADPQKQDLMREAAQKLARPDATAQIAALLQTLAQHGLPHPIDS